MLEEAIMLLPQEHLMRLAKGQLNVASLLEDGKPRVGLLAEVKAFETRSLAGGYYEPFEVNWRNSSQVSEGTLAWIADYRRFLARCVDEEGTGDPGVAREAFDILFWLADCIDDGDEILFFADEGGSWMFGVDWSTVLPSWCRALSATEPVEAFAELALAQVKARCGEGRDRMLPLVLEAGTPAQRKALEALLIQEQEGRGPGR
jgi:hypothetical protein